MALVDDVKEDVGGVVPVGEVTHLVDEQEVRPHIAREGVAERALAAGGREVLDELGGRGEEGIEAVLNGAVGDRNGEGQMISYRLSNGREGNFGMSTA